MSVYWKRRNWRKYNYKKRIEFYVEKRRLWNRRIELEDGEKYNDEYIKNKDNGAWTRYINKLVFLIGENVYGVVDYEDFDNEIFYSDWQNSYSPKYVKNILETFTPCDEQREEFNKFCEKEYKKWKKWKKKRKKSYERALHFNG